jgi:hypothetical protein
VGRSVQAGPLALGKSLPEAVMTDGAPHISQWPCWPTPVD